MQENTKDNLNQELKMLESYANIQKKKKAIIFENYNIIIMNTIRTHLIEWEELLNEATKNSASIDQNICKLEGLRKELENLCMIYNDGDETENELLLKYQEYSVTKKKQLEIILKNTNEIEEFNRKVASSVKKSIYEEDLLRPIEQSEKKVELESNQHKEQSKSRDNKVLIISEKDNKVYLPYLMEDLQRKLTESKKYETIEELIQNEYILDLDNFKNSMISRFKEAYKLIRKREKGSTIDAAQLGIELMFNYSLNPAIIAACKNEDQLDIYLDCLEENELDAFKIFDVKYEVVPMISITEKRKNKHF